MSVMRVIKDMIRCELLKCPFNDHRRENEKKNPEIRTQLFSADYYRIHTKLSVLSTSFFSS